MRLLRKTSLVLSVLSIVVVWPATAQNSISSLVVFVSVDSPENRAVAVSNLGGKVLDTSEWLKGHPFYREFLLPAKEYKIAVPGPISSVAVTTTSDASTFLEFSPITTENGEKGVEIRSWHGKPSLAIDKAVAGFKAQGADKTIEPSKLDVGSDSKISFSTDPPWPTPFDPPPDPKK
jgi:hypothetical protein